MENNMFQNIFDELQNALPEEWKRLAFYASYTDGSYGMKYYVDLGNNQYKDCYELGMYSNIELLKLFMSIDKIISPVRDNLEPEKTWSVMTMLVDNEGNMKTEFDYRDISENFIAYEREWQKKYLGK